MLRRVVDRLIERRNHQDMDVRCGLSTDHSQLAIQGWRLLCDGQREQARKYFRAALDHDPYAVGAWLGLSRAVDTCEERRACLQAAIDVEGLINRRK